MSSYFSNFYKMNGYVLIKNFFTIQEQNFIRKKAHTIKNLPWEKGKYMKYYENVKGIKQISRVENFIKYDYEFKEFLDSRINTIVEQIVGHKPVLFKDKINFKLKGGKSFSPHQDQPAWSDFPPSMFYTVSLFPDNHTIDNGCLQFAGGWNSNKKNLIPSALLESDIIDWFYLEPHTSDLLLFNSYIPHKSGPNNTLYPRQTFFFTYNNSEDGDFLEEYYNQKRIHFPPENELDPNKTYDQSGKYNWANPITNKL